jgi:hypothetical protein
MDLSSVFAYVVGVLAALAVIGALVFVVVWEVLAIRRAIATYRQSLSPQEATETFWQGDRAVAHRKW